MLGFELLALGFGTFQANLLRKSGMGWAVTGDIDSHHSHRWGTGASLNCFWNNATTYGCLHTSWYELSRFYS